MSDNNRFNQMMNQQKNNRVIGYPYKNWEQIQPPNYDEANASNIKKKELKEDEIDDIYVDRSQNNQQHNNNYLLNQIKNLDQKIGQSNDKKINNQLNNSFKTIQSLFSRSPKDIITSVENPAIDSNHKRSTLGLQINQPLNLKQTKINEFIPENNKRGFVSHHQDGSTTYIQKGFKPNQSTMEILSIKPLIQVPQHVQHEEKKKSDKINLNDLPEEERMKIFKEFSKCDREKKVSAQAVEKERERRKLEQLDDQRIKEKGKKQAEELLNEGKGSIFASIKIEKKQNSESKRLSNYKMMLEAKNGEQTVGKPVFEFNRLIKYLFLKNYFAPDISDYECKVIPNKFESGDEYCKIFEYLFLNEASAQLKQEVNEFVKKNSKSNKYRKIQIKIDETEYDKDGTIFNMRGLQQEQIEGNGNSKNEQISDYHKLKDGQCDLTQLKNYIVIVSSKFELKVSKINQIKGEEMLFFGMMIDPQKAQFLHQIKLQTFLDRSKFNPQQWYNVILFPFAKITTLIREYQMITQLQFKTPLSSLIYNPINQQHLIGSDLGGLWTAQFENIIPNRQVVAQFFDLLQTRFNESQVKSIKEIVLKDKGICLLQGPPGTGKTHTLIGLLSGVYEYMYQMNKFPKKKILICAPSNAAIDEIIVRILQKGGLFDSQGNQRQAKVLRMGLLDEESENCEMIKKVSLEDLAQHKLFQTEKHNAAQDQKTTADLRIEICQILNQIKKIEKKLRIPGIDNDVKKKLTVELEQCTELRRVKQNYLDKIRQNKKLYKESYTMLCDKLLNDAEIICSTLSSSGSDKLTRFADQIELLIVDEAAQCTEPSNIIPLRLGIKKMILIGDPRQLPATTFSAVSNQTLYNRSLFERILDNNFQPYFLDTQYRMHSEIRIFPSLYFYQDKLKDHDSTNKRVIPKDYFQKRTLFFDIQDGQEQREGTSYVNDREATVIIELIKNIKNTFMTQTIGVICSYKSQVKHIKQSLKVEFPDELAQQTSMLSVNTVDSFQGQEKDIILFSCVRSSETGGIGFLNDGRRMNVALTRAKNALFIIGNALTLSKSELWRQLLINLNQRNLYRQLENQTKFDFQKIVKDDWPEQNTKISNQLIKILSQSNQAHQQKVTYNISDFTIEGTSLYTDTNQQNNKKHPTIDKKQKETDKKQHNKKSSEQIEIEDKAKIKPPITYPMNDGCYTELSIIEQLKLEGLF